MRSRHLARPRCPRLRITLSLKKALEKAASDDYRPQASYVEELLIERLKGEGVFEEVTDGADSHFVEFMLGIVEPSGSLRGLGRRQFRSAPQIGHYISIAEEDGMVNAYEVIAVFHPIRPTNTAGDILLRLAGEESAVRQVVRTSEVNRAARVAAKKGARKR